MALYAFDGTWNSATLSDDVEAEDETNVADFYEAYDGQKWYVAGPGTRHSRIGKVIGGLTGAGGHRRVGEAYDALCKTWEAGDTTIDVVGFSRGAALALDFGHKVLDDGIRRPGTKQVIHENPHIRFLGLWDLVGSFGIPIDVGSLSFQATNFGHRLSLPDGVEYCFHAMAMDERRQTFRVTRLLNGYEVWFRGVHSDVGGGNGNVGLSYIALRWMLRKARAAGLPIKDAIITSRDPRIDPTAALRLAKDLIPNEHRGFLKGDRLHYTVTERPGHNNPPGELLRETEQAEAEALRTRSLARGEPAPL
jgi:uncharacterized protein (DUF2235 family)